jgi:hypothetical protein
MAACLMHSKQMVSPAHFSRLRDILQGFAIYSGQLRVPKTGGRRGTATWVFVAGYLIFTGSPVDGGDFDCAVEESNCETRANWALI